MNTYNLSRQWFNFCFDNPEKIKPSHTAVYFFAIENCNRLGWKKKFRLPSQMVMEAVGIKSYNTYIKTFNDIIDFGFFELIERSKNQYSANLIALSNFDKAVNKALDKALVRHSTKQDESTVQSIDSINKQETIEQETNNQDADALEDTVILEVISYLNEKTGKSFKTAPGLKTRFKEGYTVDDCKKVIDIKCAEWAGTEQEKYLRPQTLFSNKFDSYVNQEPEKKYTDLPYIEEIKVYYDTPNMLVYNENGTISTEYKIDPKYKCVVAI